MKRVFPLIAVAILSVSLTGCPDYSHLKEVPDYSSQRDTDSGDLSEAEKAKQAQEEAEGKRSEE